ncbi:hypothetical protein ACF3NV_09395 [Moraxella atlantae]|uniref:hypothetical protein n=1 Tax=Faucicola atlantae TaxID=34059 RepID=UPI003753336B
MSSQNHTLPAHIRQLVDKKNYVIAIKTHAQEQGMSLADAKAQIDAYEHSQAPVPVQTKTAVQHNGIEHLRRGVDQHLTDHNIRLPWLKRWQKRVLIFAMIVVVLGFLVYRQFG